MVSGTTSHKLDVISTYDNVRPFKVGNTGISDGFTYLITNIDYVDPILQTGYTKIYYTIGDIDYVTTYRPPTNQFDIKTHPTTFSTMSSGYNFEPYLYGNNQLTFDIKEEAKMGLVFPPKVNNELFIERMSVAVFERHSRLAEIKSLEGLVEYRNGYYNIVENS
jgi:hypothetical protein